MYLLIMLKYPKSEFFNQKVCETQYRINKYYIKGEIKMKKEIIFTKKAPMPKGPYSQAVKAGNLLYVSGQAAVDPKTGKFLAPGDIETQTDLVMKNIEEILKAGGSSLENVIKSSVFIDDISKFNDFNNVYKKYFIKEPPARSTVEIGHFFEGMCVEIDVIAIVP